MCFDCAAPSLTPRDRQKSGSGIRQGNRKCRNKSFHTYTKVTITAAFLGHNISMNYVAHICCLETLTTSGAKHVLMKLFPLEKFSPYLVQIYFSLLAFANVFSYIKFGHDNC